MFFQTVFVSLIQILFGLVVCFAGFRLFVVLLPLWGFFAGFLASAQAIQQLFGGGFLSTVGSWVFGFVIGILFAVAAYFFYYAAVAILAGTVGYEIGVGLMAGLGINAGVLQFIIGLIVAAALIAAVVFFNLPKVFVVGLTALAGASMILSGILIALGRVSLNELQWGLVGAFVRSSWLWSLVFLAIVAIGVVVQLMVPDGYSLAPYERNEAMRGAPLSGQAAPVPSPSSGSAPAL